MDMKVVTLMILMVAVLAVSVVQAIQLNDIEGKISVNGVVTAKAVSGAPDTSGWTAQEKMMYEHHGVLPARLSGSAASASSPSSGMVGGC